MSGWGEEEEEGEEEEGEGDEEEEVAAVGTWSGIGFPVTRSSWLSATWKVLDLLAPVVTVSHRSNLKKWRSVSSSNGLGQ